MATNASARSFPDIPNVSTCVISTANPNLDGTGSLTTLVTSGGMLGLQVNRIHINAVGATTQGMIRIFVKSGPAAQAILINEIPVPALTPSGNTPAWDSEYIPSPFAMQPGASILVSTEKGETFHITALGYSL